MPKRSTLTGLAAVLFTVGIVLLLTAIFRSTDHGGGPLVWIALVALAGTIGCWFAAARADSARPARRVSRDVPEVHIGMKFFRRIS